MVQITNQHREDKTMYGAVLYLNGFRVYGKKTFSGRTLFQGFKLGDGKCREFNFDTANIGKHQDRPGNETHSSMNSKDPAEAALATKHRNKPNTIIVEIFQTE